MIFLACLRTKKEQANIFPCIDVDYPDSIKCLAMIMLHFYKGHDEGNVFVIFGKFFYFFVVKHFSCIQKFKSIQNIREYRRLKILKFSKMGKTKKFFLNALKTSKCLVKFSKRIRNETKISLSF